jgi:hypothetical protein
MTHQYTNQSQDKKTDAKFLRAVLVRTFILLIVFATIILAVDPARALGKTSFYNNLFPGRERFPYGENPQRSYNMTINDLDAMFASHAVAQEKSDDEFRVFVFGDSSVWGTLLRNEETLTGLLNQQGIKTCDGKKVIFYNLGYPTISLEKDVLLLNRAMAYQPDLILWPLTLEAFPGMNPSTSPLLDINREEVIRFFPSVKNENPEKTSLLDRVQAQRRGLADWFRYQIYGVLWAATGIDQDLTQKWEPAQRDFDFDSTFNGREQFDLAADLDFTPLSTGLHLAEETSVWLVNEPILVSRGENNQLRYNFFYPRWAYDAFREAMQGKAEFEGWTYFDLWDIVPEGEFTNSAIHLAPAGEKLLSNRLAEKIQTALGCQ